jgi:hypothetical protein
MIFTLMRITCFFQPAETATFVHQKKKNFDLQLQSVVEWLVSSPSSASLSPSAVHDCSSLARL